MVVRAPATVPGARLEQRSDVVQGPAQLAEWPAADGQNNAIGWQIEAHDHAHCRGLSGTVRTEKTGNPPRQHLEGQVVDSGSPAEPLGETACFDHRGLRCRVPRCGARRGQPAGLPIGLLLSRPGRGGPGRTR